MRRVLALVLIAALGVSFALPPAAHAGGCCFYGNPVAVGVAALLFAPFVIVGGVLTAILPPYRPLVEPPPVYRVETARYATVNGGTYAPSSGERNVVRYPHGRYVLRGDGVTTAYQWVWIPNPPPPPPPGPLPQPQSPQS